MKILHVTDSFYPIVGGSETAVRYLSDTMVDLGHEVEIAVMSMKDASCDSKKVKFSLISSKIFGVNMRFFGKVHNLKKIIRSFKPDVVNAHFLLESGYVGVKAAHALGIPCVVTIRGKGLFYTPDTLLQKLLFRIWHRGVTQADAFIATSQEMADMAKERFKINVKALSNGVDTKRFRPDAKSDVRSGLGIQEDQTMIFCARRLVPKNGIEFLIRALPTIMEQRDVVLVLASKKVAEYEKLKALTAELGIADKVHFLGPVEHDRLPAHFCEADVVVQPSIAEARSLACLEAMACGSAIVATNTGGLKELLREGISAKLIDPFEESTYQVGEIKKEDVERLANAVLHVLSDDEYRKRIQDGAHAEAQKYSWKNIASQAIDIYNSVL